MASIYKNIMISDEPTYIGKQPIDTPLDIEIDVEPPLIGALPDGLAQERAQLQEKNNALSALLNRIPEAIKQNRQQLSTEIADIVLLIASKFFINQQQDKNAISDQITQILTQLNEKQNIEIALHPQDLALIQQGEINIDPRSCKNIRLKPDDNLRLGGCIIKSEHGVFNAGIERQIDHLKQVLLQMKAGS